jgi:membrane protease subunit (stomatin/prohibitin family)
MKNQEAITQLKEINREAHIYSEAVEMAISALEKQIPKKPKSVFCPQCGEEFTDYDCWSADYCRNCGQAIDWGNE